MKPKAILLKFNLISFNFRPCSSLSLPVSGRKGTEKVRRWEIAGPGHQTLVYCHPQERVAASGDRKAINRRQNSSQVPEDSMLNDRELQRQFERHKCRIITARTSSQHTSRLAQGIREEAQEWRNKSLSVINEQREQKMLAMELCT